MLVGRKEEIEKYLGEDRSNIEIVDARDIITMEDDPEHRNAPAKRIRP